MLILSEQTKRAFNSEYFTYFEVQNLTPNYLINNPDKYDAPYAVVGYNEVNDCSYILGSYSTQDIADGVFLYFVQELASDYNIASVPTERHYLEANR